MRLMHLVILSALVTVAVTATIAADLPRQPSAIPCFSSQTVQGQQVSTSELQFTFQANIHLCDGNGYTSGTISDAKVVVFSENGGATFTFTYSYYNGNGTYRGEQDTILTIQDTNGNQILTRPIFDQNTPRLSCTYGHTVTGGGSGGIGNYFNNLGYMTLQIPRVSQTQYGC